MPSIQILDVNKFVRGLTPVTSTEYTTKTGEFNEEGLFSEKIFGVEGSLDRQKKFSFINLNAFIVHPAAYKILVRLDRKIELMLSTEKSFSIDKDGGLVLDENGETGMSSFINFFPKINFRGDTDVRKKLILLLQSAYKQGSLFVDKLPIIPPDFRPMFQDETGNWIIDEINNIYVNILRKSFQMKSAGKGGALYDLLNFGLQKAVNDHDKYIRTKISKKSGLIRANMMGKRVDYSGRAVITPGPNLDINQIGFPLQMAVSLFDPFLKHYIIFSQKYPYKSQLEEEIKNHMGLDLSVDSLGRILKSIKNGDKIPSSLEQLIFNATEIVMKDRIILAKRDPALHEGSYRAFNPVLIKGHTVQLSTTQVGSFNADFDGDQMAFFHPLSSQAQAEAKERMMRAAGSKTNKEFMFEIGKEMCAGLYTMTKSVKISKSPIAVTADDLDRATDPYVPVRYRGRTTTMGKAIFNSLFPTDFPWVEGPVTKKIANGLIKVSYEKYGEEVTMKIYSKMSKLGFKFATIVAPTITLDMLEIPPSIMRMKEKLVGATTAEADKLIKQMGEILVEHLKGTGLYDLVESGSGKGWDQPKQILVAKGIISDTKGNVLPAIKGSFSEGLRTTEFFDAAAGARKGMADRALNTADTGYFTRQLVYLLSPVEADPFNRDCKTRRTIALRLTEKLIDRLHGRFILDAGGKLLPFKENEYKPGQTISLRTPILCESPKLCFTCYGELLKRHRTPFVGVLAATSIGERGTQLIMRTFHTGGAATVIERNVLEDMIQNDPIVKITQNKLAAYIEQLDNNVFAQKPGRIIIDMSNYQMNDTIQIKDKSIWVKSLVAQIEFQDLLMSLILDYQIELARKPTDQVSKNSVVLEFNRGDKLFEIPLVVDNIKDQVNYVKRLVGGREIYKGPGHLLQKIYKIYGPLSDMDLVHMEVLTSQCFRDRKIPEIPARLGRIWDPVMANLKNNVFASGFMQGLAFENINKAVETGLISDQLLDRSIMERILTGDLVRR